MLGAETIAMYGLRLIAPDRPGIGRSSFQPGRTFLDWPGDVLALADALGLGRFGILGVSGGGPFALACALKIPERLTVVEVVSGVAPFDAPGAIEGMGPGLQYFRLASRAPFLVRIQLKMMAMGVKEGVDPQRFFAQASGTFAPPDRLVFQDPQVRDGFIGTLRAFLQAGTKGPAYEAGLYARPWGYRLEDIAVPVKLWHGEEDRNAPIAMGRYMAKALPRCQAHFYPGEAHISILAHYAGEILSNLREKPPAGAGG